MPWAEPPRDPEISVEDRETLEREGFVYDEQRGTWVGPLEFGGPLFDEPAAPGPNRAARRRAARRRSRRS